MTDRVKGLIVLLGKDIRTDDCEAIVEAIKMVKGVAAVSMDVSDHNDWMARERVRLELREKLWEILK